MASWRYYHDKRNKKVQSWPLKIIVSHRGDPKPVATGFSLAEDEWDSEAEKILKPFKNVGRANAKLSRLEAIVGEVIDAVGPNGSFTNSADLQVQIQLRIDREFNKVAQQERGIVFSGDGRKDFLVYARKIDVQFRKEKRFGSAKPIIRAVELLERFSGRKTLSFEDLNVSFLNRLEKWYLAQTDDKGNPRKINGLGILLRAMRQVFNLALKDESLKLRKDQYPFGRGKYSIKTEKTENRSIELSDIAKLIHLPLPVGSRLWMHQQYLTFAFDGWGANFKDLAFMRVRQVLDDRMKYRRQKTAWSQNSKPFNIELTDRQKRIVDYFSAGKGPDDLLFPILEDVMARTNDPEEIDLVYEKRMRNHYRRIRTLCKQAGLPDHSPSGIYVIRHSFFQGALESGVSKEEIQGMAGHASMITTETYTKGFRSEHLNRRADRVRNGVSPEMLSENGEHLSVVTDQTDDPASVLEQSVRIKGVGPVSVRDFLLESLPSALNDGSISRIKLITDLLTKTDCNDGKIAAHYVDQFLAA